MSTLTSIPRRSGRWRTTRAIRACLCAIIASLSTRADAAEFVGRRVTDVLAELRSQGLFFVYNTAVLDERARVGKEPRAPSGIELAKEILAEQGLTLANVGENVYAVSKRAQPGESATLSEVVVVSSRYALANDATGPHVVINQQELQAQPRLGDETLRAVQRLPGVASNGFSSLGAIRGGAPGEIAIVLDGLRLSEPFHLKNFLSPTSLLDARLIERMEIFAGGFSARYGDRLSAIIDAHSIQPTTHTPRYYEVGLSAFHLNALAGGQFESDAGGPLQVLISARRSNLSELARLPKHDFGRPSYSDGYARLDRTLANGDRVALHALLSRDKIEARRNGGRQRAHAEYRNNYLWSTFERAWSEQSSARVLVGYTDVTNDRSGRIDSAGERTAEVADLRTFTIGNISLDFAWLDGLQGLLDQRLGLEARTIAAKYRYASDVRIEPDYPFAGLPARRIQRTTEPRPKGHEYSAYWEGRIDLGKSWGLLGGLRSDYRRDFGAGHATQWSPRVGVLFSPNAATKLRASWGRYAQMQGVGELQVEDGVDRFYPAQRADHVIASIERDLDSGTQLRVEAYRKKYRRVQPRYENLFNPLVLLPEAEYDRVMIAPVSAEAKGVETLLTVRPDGAWSGWLSYAWSQARDRVAVLNSYRDVPRSWDQTHAFNVGLAWTKAPWTVSLVNTFHTGWPTTELSLVAGAPVTGPRNADRFAPFNSLDLRATRTYPLRRGALDVFLEVVNAANRQNPCCTRYFGGRDTAGEAVLDSFTDHWLGIAPSLGVLWRY